MDVQTLKEEVINGKLISKEEAMFIADADLEEICSAADVIREAFCGKAFDICTIINGKSGRCSENCKYCAQSGCAKNEVESYALLDKDTILKDAKRCAEQGVVRYSIVTSGRSLNDEEVESACESIMAIKKETCIEVCVSFGLLNEEQFRKLKDAGVTRIHNNLETSRRYFPSVCSTHTYDEKIETIKAAKRAGLQVCSGGIMGIGETMEDRIDMVMEQRELGVKSIPVNMLNPIKGTPYENNEPLTQDEMRRIVAVFRFIVPDASIRLAGGRGLMEDKGVGCLISGANAAISGDMLTTCGINVEKDLEIINELGYVPRLWNA